MSTPLAPQRYLANSPRYADYYRPGTRLEQEFRAMLAIQKTARAWTRSLEKDLRRRTGQTRVRWEMLFAIAFADGPTTASAVAERLGVQWPALVRILDALESDGLILRRENPEDGRSRLIELTELGHETIAKVQSVVDPARADLFSVLSDEELQQHIEMTERLLARLEGD